MFLWLNESGILPLLDINEIYRTNICLYLFIYVLLWFAFQDEQKEETPATKPIVGIIYPPPEVRNIVDKTASFVARFDPQPHIFWHACYRLLIPGSWINLSLCIIVYRNGPEFEARIRQNEINNPKFNFLTPTDPYHAYYRHKVNEFKEGKAQEPSAAVPKVMLQSAQQSQQLPQKVWLLSSVLCVILAL